MQSLSQVPEAVNSQPLYDCEPVFYRPGYLKYEAALAGRDGYEHGAIPLSTAEHIPVDWAGDDL